MGDASNHKKHICTTLSGHVVEDSGPRGAFKTTDGRPPVRVTNFTFTSLLGTDRTERTLSGGAHIWTTKGVLDGAEDGVHSGYREPDLVNLSVGTRSGEPPHQPATALTPSSRDLKIEGGWVMRTDDRAHLDAKNSDGQIHEGGEEGGILVDDSAILNACNVVAIGAQQAPREPDGAARYFGPEPGNPGFEGGYLEVLEGANIHCFVERYDTTSETPEAAPICIATAKGQPGHTRWKLVWRGVLKDWEERIDPTDAGIDLTPADFPNPCPDFIASLYRAGTEIKPSWMGEEGKITWDRKQEPKDPSKDRFDDAVKAEQAKDAVQVGDFYEHDTRDRDESVEERTNRETAERDQSMENAQKEAAQTLYTLLRLWHFNTKSPELQITASGCAGSIPAKIKIYPSAAFEIDIFKAFGPLIQKLLSFLEGAKKVSTAIASIVSVAVTAKVEMEWLQNPSCKLGFKFVELTEDGFNRAGDPYYAVQVGKEYWLTFGFDPLIKIGWEISCSLFDLFGFIGKLFKKGAEYLQVTARLRLAFILDVGISVGIKRLATNDFILPTGEIAFKPHFVVGVEINVRDVVEIKVQADFAGEIKIHQFNGNTCNDPKCSFELTISGKTGMSITGGISFDLAGLAEKEEDEPLPLPEPGTGQAPKAPGAGDKHKKTKHTDDELSFEFEYPVENFTFPKAGSGGDLVCHLDWFKDC